MSQLSDEEKEALEEREIDLSESLDSLKSWSVDARMKLLEYVENGQMSKAGELISNDGVVQTPIAGGGGGAGAIVPTQPPAVPEVPVAAQPEVPIDPQEPIQISVSFKDIEGHWAKATIEKMASLGLTSGVSPDNFGPDIRVTRSQMVAFIVKMLNLDLTGEDTVPFKDINKDAWDYNFIKAAYVYKLANGVSADAFDPGREVTREQMIVMMMNALNYSKLALTQPKTVDIDQYGDSNEISAWALEPMKTAVNLGLIQGKGNGTLDPKGPATRAEVMVIIEKVYNLIYNQL